MEQEKKKINLKIIIPIILVVIIAIVGIVLNKNNTIKLNMENYTKYLNVQATVLGSTSDEYIGNFYKKSSLFVKARGTSNNFNYNDIVIQVEFTGTITRYNGTTEDIKETVTLNKCDISGNGEIFVTLLDEATSKDNYISFKDNSGYYNSVKGNIVSITGTVTPIK